MERYEDLNRGQLLEVVKEIDELLVVYLENALEAAKKYEDAAEKHEMGYLRGYNIGLSIGRSIESTGLQALLKTLRGE